MKRLALLVVAGLAIVGCSKEVSSSELKSATSEKFVNALQNSNEIQIFKILPKHRDSNPEKRGYNVEPKEKTLSADQIARLKKLLLNDESYIFTSRKEAPFFAEVIFTIDEEYTLLVSFSAQQMKIKGPDTKVKLDIDPMSIELEHFSMQVLKK